jgi:acyl-CoA dehydrogenase
VLSVLRRLLRDAPAPIHTDDVAAWWNAFCDRRPDVVEPVDHALVAGFSADRVGYALAGGYEAALRIVAPSLPERAIASFCATEQGGNHPRAIETRLTADGDRLSVTGAKRWSTMGPLAGVLLVVASEGVDDAGRNRLRVVAVDARAPGVTVRAMSPPPFVPEVPHGIVELDRVVVDASALLPGDGYVRYVKPFRTIEDIHVHAAVLGYLLSVARRSSFGHDAIERLLAGVVTTRALASLDPARPETHVALAGLLAADARMIADLAPSWARVDAAERDRWQRDQALFGVAGKIRELRRQRAWEALTSAEHP